jgi:hypothetical protein
MSRHMGPVPARTTIRLDEGLLDHARGEAQRRGMTLTALIEEGLRLVMARNPGVGKTRIEIPICRNGGGTLPGVDLNDSGAMLDLMEERV